MRQLKVRATVSQPVPVCTPRVWHSMNLRMTTQQGHKA